MAEQEVEYCRIENNTIVEYPVYAIHIRNRAHPVSMYTPVKHLAKPILPAFAYYTQSIELTGGVPVVSYGYVFKSLDTVLRELHTRSPYGPPSLPGSPNDTGVLIGEIAPETVQYVYELSKVMAQKYLDDWAHEREYDGIATLAGYATSKNPARAAEGQKGVDNRDMVWDAFYAYHAKVTTGELPVPRSEADIRAQLPVISW